MTDEEKIAAIVNENIIECEEKAWSKLSASHPSLPPGLSKIIRAAYKSGFMSGITRGMDLIENLGTTMQPILDKYEEEKS